MAQELPVEDNDWCTRNVKRLCDFQVRVNRGYTPGISEAAIEFQRVGDASNRTEPRDGKCDIGAFEFTDFTRATLVVTGNANVDPERGIAMLTGTAKCSANSNDRLVPNDLPLRVKLTQEQKGGGKPVVVSASTTITVKCGLTTASWGVPLPPPASDRQWKDGAAVAQLETDPVATPQWIAPASVSAPVKLTRPRT